MSEVHLYGCLSGRQQALEIASRRYAGSRPHFENFITPLICVSGAIFFRYRAKLSIGATQDRDHSLGISSRPKGVSVDPCFTANVAKRPEVYPIVSFRYRAEPKDGTNPAWWEVTRRARIQGS